MIEKGLIGKEGKIEKVVKEIEMIEDYALEKIAQNRINQAKKKVVMLDTDLLVRKPVGSLERAAPAACMLLAPAGVLSMAPDDKFT